MENSRRQLLRFLRRLPAPTLTPLSFRLAFAHIMTYLPSNFTHERKPGSSGPPAALLLLLLLMLLLQMMTTDEQTTMILASVAEAFSICIFPTLKPKHTRLKCVPLLPCTR